jgi:hypothetical protein
MYDLAVRSALFALVRMHVGTVNAHAAAIRREAAEVNAVARFTRDEARANLAELRQRMHALALRSAETRALIGRAALGLWAGLIHP